MAVFTPVSDQECREFLTLYHIGEFQRLECIPQGVENSNFHLHTTQGRYILTLFEKRTSPADLPYFMALKAHLAAKSIPCPAPIPMRSGKVLHSLNQRPSVILSFLEGQHLTPEAMTLTHYHSLGQMLGKLHDAGRDFTGTRPNSLTVADWHSLAARIIPGADSIAPGLEDSIQQTLAAAAHWPHQLTTGPIHADLFPDNVFFDSRGRVCGLIDFYFACTDALLYDLAIVLNAWCFDAAHRFITPHAHALIRGYTETITLPIDEWQHLPLLCRGAALRFLLTRAYDWLNHPPDALVTPKDPLEYAAKLRFFTHITNAREIGYDG